MGKRSTSSKKGGAGTTAAPAPASGAGDAIKVLPKLEADIRAGVRYHTEPDAGEAQSWPASILACTTLALFVGWIHILTVSAGVCYVWACQARQCLSDARVGLSDCGIRLRVALALWRTAVTL